MTDNSDYPSYFGDTDRDIFDRAFDDIVECLVNGSAQFLFGAGMSASSEIPTGKELSRELLNRYFPTSGTNRPSPERLEKMLDEFPFEGIVEAVQENLRGKRAQLTGILKGIFLDPKYGPSQAHHDFLSLCYGEGRPRLNFILTTNFDTLFEQLFGPDRSIAISERNSKEIRTAQDDGLIPVLHLHGTLDGEYQITETDVFDEKFSLLATQMRTALNQYDAFVFVGYSMSDPDFRRLYMRYRNDIQSKRELDKVNYLVSPADSFSYRLGKEVWAQRGITWIPLDAKTFFARLKKLMESRFDVEVRRAVMEKHNLKDEKALDDLVMNTAKILEIEPPDAILFLLEARTRLGGAK